MKNLTESQMEVLYYNFLISPSDEEYRKAYRSQEEKVDDGSLKDLGYSEEEMEEIKTAISDL